MSAKGSRNADRSRGSGVRRVTHELKLTRQSLRHRDPKFATPPVPRTSSERLEKARATSSVPHTKPEETILYLAYGSNLCAATFRGVRGIKPLSEVNVLVPSLTLSFDLPGIPYNEPCFANSARRKSGEEQNYETYPSVARDTTPLLPRTNGDAHWDKGLVGVVYEVTPSDYAHIIATEGGGASYKDILVECHLLSSDPTIPVPSKPTNVPFKAHTLFAPAAPDDEVPPFARSSHRNEALDRRPRPNPPGYAQPSPRYLDLIVTGAAEHSLPDEYRSYLSTLQPYVITTRRQEMGKYIILMTFGPLLALILRSNRPEEGDGTWPDWFVRIAEALFSAIWWSYDHVLRKQFGDGERTDGDGDEEGVDRNARLLNEKAELTFGSGRVESSNASYGGLQSAQEKDVSGMV